MKDSLVLVQPVLQILDVRSKGNEYLFVKCSSKNGKFNENKIMGNNLSSLGEATNCQNCTFCPARS